MISASSETGCRSGTCGSGRGRQGLICYDEIDRSDVQYLLTQSRALFSDIEEAAGRLPSPFARDPLVRDNLENLRSDMAMWGVSADD
jgi:hypothetical protein